MTMEAMVDWLPEPWNPAATAWFEFYESDEDEEPWWRHRRTFGVTDRAIGDGDILTYVRETVDRAATIYARLLGLRALAGDLAALGRTQHGPIWREVTWSNVPAAAAIVTTIAWYIDDTTPVPRWPPESQRCSAEDPAMDATQLARAIDERTAFIAESYDRSLLLASAAGFVLGARFPIG